MLELGTLMVERAGDLAMVNEDIGRPALAWLLAND
jgi:hypothetical protein